MADGSVITFYSYKGGVGRTFLLANVGATLSRWGYRVLCVDFDLEAPGLTHYFDGWAKAEDASAQVSIRCDEPAATGYGLTARERDVLELLAQGLTNKEIAVRLSGSDTTVKAHLASAYRKLGVNNRAAALQIVGKLPLPGAIPDPKAEPADEKILIVDAGRDRETVNADAIASNHAGLLELVEAFNKGDSVELEEFLSHIELPSPHAPLALLAAGRRDDSYMARVQQLDWGRLYAERNLGAKFERIRSAWTSRFDFVLVDSRTGVSDTGGICTAQLPDILVTVFAPNRQNLDGIVDVATKSAARRNELPYDRQGLITIPVLSRFDQRTEHELARAWLKLVEQRLEPLLKPWVHRDVSAAQFFERVVVPYFSAWSFGEDVPAVEVEENTGPERINYYIDTVAALLANRGAGTAELISNRDSYVNAVTSRSPGAVKPRYDVYLSYSTVDVDFARELYSNLSSHEMKVFFDMSEDKPGTDLTRRISAAIQASAAMVAVIGKTTSRWQMENIRLFLSESKLEERPVIPVVLPQADEGSIPRFLRQYKEVRASERTTAEVARAVEGMLHAYQAPGVG